MDGITQQNAANAEESASAAEELSSQSEQLRSMVTSLNQLIEGGCGTRTLRNPIHPRRAVRGEQAAASRPPRGIHATEPASLVGDTDSVGSCVSADGAPEDLIPFGDEDLSEF